MKNKLGNKERLGHIIDSINFIEQSMMNVSEEEFQRNFILHTAVQKWFEIIGEASYQITKEYKQNHSIIEWKAIEGLRHILVHDYFGVDLIKIWSFYKQLLPGLKLEITKLYKEFE
jgi:uncharacterized protein with HEPN domain